MSKKKLKIAIFHLGFFFSGGGEKLVIQEAIGLSKLGHQVVLYAPVVDRKNCFPDLIGKVEIHSLFFPFSFRFPLRDFLAICTAVFVTPLTFWRFSKFDIFFGANQPGPLICFFLAKILRKPYVIYLAQPTRLIYPRKVDRELGFGKGSFDFFYFLAKIFRPLVSFLDRVSIQNASVILANGDYMAKILEKTYSRKVVVCPAGCYPQKVLPEFKQRWQGKIRIHKRTIPKPFILVTNRHFPQKKLIFAIKSFSLVGGYSPGLSLVITGAPTYHTDSLLNSVSTLGLEGKVVFTGLISEKDLHKLYSRAALYVYTSPEEDFGMGVIEAMASGCPVVAWNHAGPTVTVVDGVTGFLAKPYQLKDYVKKIKQILTDPSLAKRMGQAGHRRVSDNFSYERHWQTLEKTLLSPFANCGGMAKELSEKELHEIWEQAPTGYYESANFWQRLWHKRKWRAVGKMLGGKGEKVLDLGCANGYSTSQIGALLSQAQIIGIDVSEKLIKYAQKNYPEFKFLVANGENLPFKDEVFDTIVCTEVIEHVASPQKMLGEIKRVLKPNGKLILELDSGSRLFRFIWFFWTNFSKGRVWGKSHLHQFKLRDLESLMNGNAFLVEKRAITHLGMAVTFLVSKKKL